MELSEKQLLLLDEFMYSDIAPKNEGRTLDEIITENYVDPATGQVSLEKIQQGVQNGTLQLSGDLPKNPEYLADVMQQIHSDPHVNQLVIDRTTEEYEGGIRGACFVDPATGEATVAFRGTGGTYQQWSNNFEGYGDVSQQSEIDAANFINSLPYQNITVTGHSNGGNQAMYVTVVCGDKVDRCVSYEGQGGSNEFMEAYKNEIAQNQGKITNICAEKDFVSPLLNDYAGKTVYVKSDSSMLFGLLSHGGYGILSAGERNGSFDENGNFRESAFVPQSPQASAIHDLTVWLADHSDMPIVGPILELFTDVTGGLVGMIISEGLNMFNLLDPKVLEMHRQNFTNLIGSLIDFSRDMAHDVKGLFERGIQAIEDLGQKAYDSFTSWISSVFGGGSSGGGKGAQAGGRANVIKVSTEDIAATIQRYVSGKNTLMSALTVCNNASSLLAQSWAGPSFAALSIKMASTYKNLFQTMERMDDAISELKAVIGIMDRTEKSVSAMASSLDTGISPFA